MARPRVCPHEVRCPECGSNRMPKDGASKGRQVDHCGDCGRRTIPDAAYQHPSAADQERALAMYQEGSSLSALRMIGATREYQFAWQSRPAATPAPLRRGIATAADWLFQSFGGAPNKFQIRICAWFHQCFA